MIKKFVLSAIITMAFGVIYSVEISELKFYSNGDYGIEYLGKSKLPLDIDFYFREGISDQDGFFYCLTRNALQKMSPDGDFLWQVGYDGYATRLSFIDGDLFLPVKNWNDSKKIVYGNSQFEATRSVSYFLLRIDSQNGTVKNIFELEVDDFVKKGFDPFDEYRNGYAISDEGKLFFMFDINEDYSRVNKDYPVSFDRYGDNDKCLFIFTKDLELEKTICIGSDKNDETEEINSEHLSSYMTFAGDTLFMYVPFLGNKCNISLDSSKPVFAKNTTEKGKACAAFCKYLVKEDKIELLAYNVINGNDGQVKRFAVNSKNKVIACKPEYVWDSGNDSFFEIQPDMTLRELHGYAYVPTWQFDSKQEPRFLFDEYDDIIRITTAYDEIKFSDNIELSKTSSLAGSRIAKYDGESLENRWVLSVEDTGIFPFFRVTSSKGMVYMIIESGNFIDLDPSDETAYANAPNVVRYIETYRVKTSSENMSIIVNGGNDMVQHGADAEIVATANPGYHIEKITTSKGENVDFSWDGHCTIKNVTEPIELIVTTAEGETSVDQRNTDVSVVYPNPFVDVINVNDADGASYEILDMTGRMVVSGTVSEGTIPTDMLSAGIYTLTIKKEEGSYSKRVVKE